MRSTLTVSMEVRTWGSTPIGSGGRLARTMWPGAASRVSSRAAWSCSRYSAMDASTSSALRSPRFISDSVYWARTVGLALMRRYISGSV